MSVKEKRGQHYLWAKSRNLMCRIHLASRGRCAISPDRPTQGWTVGEYILLCKVSKLHPPSSLGLDGDGQILSRFEYMQEVPKEPTSPCSSIVFLVQPTDCHQRKETGNRPWTGCCHHKGIQRHGWRSAGGCGWQIWWAGSFLTLWYDFSCQAQYQGRRVEVAIYHHFMVDGACVGSLCLEHSPNGEILSASCCHRWSVG